MTTAHDLSRPDDAAGASIPEIPATSATEHPGTGSGPALLGMAGHPPPSTTGTFARANTNAGDRRPRAWAAPITRPAARIAVAGGLAVAGWLLGAVLSQANAATEAPADRPSALTQDDSGHQHAGTSTSGTLTWDIPGTDRYRVAVPSSAGEASSSSQASGYAYSTAEQRTPAVARPGASAGYHARLETTAAQGSATNTRPETLAGPSARPGPSVNPGPAADARPGTPAGPGSATGARPGNPGNQPETPAGQPPAPIADAPASHDTGLLGGLLGGGHSGPAGLVGGLLGLVDGTVDTTVHTTLTSVDTVIETAPARVIVPPVEDVLDPIGTGSESDSACGAVTATTAAKPATPIQADEPVIARVVSGGTAPVSHTAVPHVVAVPPAPVKTKQDPGRPAPVDERTQAGGGSSGGGLPDAPSAPAAPASAASAGHDGSGGLRQPFAVASDENTVTQLKLIGVSRDHEVDGAGRDAALPSTSPD